VRYFFPDGRLNSDGGTFEANPFLTIDSRTDGTLGLEWMGTRYHLEGRGGPFTEDQLRLLAAIGAVLSARYRSIFFPASAASTARLFEGLQEDRFVSAFLDHFPYLDENGLPTERDVLGDAIHMLRESSLITYENRRISTGVILLGAQKDANHSRPRLPENALPYTSSLVTIKSFHRLCEGLRTVFLVDADGLLVDLADVQRFSLRQRPAACAERSQVRRPLFSHAGRWTHLPGSYAQWRNQGLRRRRSGFSLSRKPLALDGYCRKISCVPHGHG
jgi:hypothetical protein